MNEVCGVGLILDIDKIMYQLSRWRPIFHSEADFQFSLAWLIKKKYPECEIRLEFVPDFNPNLHLDILVILDGVNVNIRMYNFDDVQCTVIPSVAYGFVTGMNLQLC